MTFIRGLSTRAKFAGAAAIGAMAGLAVGMQITWSASDCLTTSMFAGIEFTLLLGIFGLVLLVGAAIAFVRRQNRTAALLLVALLLMTLGTFVGEAIAPGTVC